MRKVFSIGSTVALVLMFLVACSASPTPVPTPLPTPVPNATPTFFEIICGYEYHARAWVDDNGNGIWEIGEPPLPGVIVHISRNGPGSRDRAEPDATDEDGKGLLRSGAMGETNCATLEVQSNWGLVVYPEIPAGYRLTTEPQLIVQGQNTFQFGFLLDAPTDTRTTTPGVRQ